MTEIIAKISAAFVCAVIFCLMTIKTLGAMQQSGYKTKNYVRWLRRKDNLFYNRLFVLALSLFVFTLTTSLSFSFLDSTYAWLVSAIPFFGFLILFMYVDRKRALKLPYAVTSRFVRLFVVYLVLTFATNFGLLTLLWYLMECNGSTLYSYIAFAPFSLLPLLLPYLLCLVNWVCAPFENARNRRYVLRAGKVLEESNCIRVGIVGSYGKTSVKHILKTILAEKYAVLETPQSYNTPMGVARTITKEGLDGVEVFIAEMGARKRGDIQELCDWIKPDYAIFTGVCEQHIATFQTLDNVFAEKSKIIENSKMTVCAETLKERVNAVFGDKETVCFAEMQTVNEIEFLATQTKCVITLGGERISVETSLLGNAAIENILLAATLAHTMGVSAEEIERGIAKITPIPHRLQLIEKGGVYILDDGYNCNPRSAMEAITALGRFEGRKCIVTPGIVEGGVLEEKINVELGNAIAESGVDYTILVGETLVCAVKNGYLEKGGNEETLVMAKTLDEAKTYLSKWLQTGDAVLFLNDLPDVY